MLLMLNTSAHSKEEQLWMDLSTQDRVKNIGEPGWVASGSLVQLSR